MSKSINIQVTEDDLKQMLDKHLIIQDKDKFLNLLCGHLFKDRYAMEQVFKALLGSYPQFIYKKGDYVYVDNGYLATWRVDKGLTLLLPGVIDEKYIPCKIVSVDFYGELSYKVEYLGIKTGDVEATVQSYDINEQYIYKKVEDVESVLEDMDSINIKKDDNPF